MSKQSNVAGTVSMKGESLQSSCTLKSQMSGHTPYWMQRLHCKVLYDAALSHRFAALKALMPGHEKADKATFLGNIVAYIKQLQVRRTPPRYYAQTRPCTRFVEPVINES